MLAFFVIALFIAAAAMAFIALPLLRTRTSVQRNGDQPEERLQARLAAIETDRAFYLIDSDSAVEAEAEARTVANDIKGDGEFGRVARIWRSAAVFFLGAAPLAAAFLYYNIGAPQSLDRVRPAASSQLESAEGPNADQAAAIAAMPEEERRAMIESMVSSLAARLASEPADPEGWRMLARSYGVLGRSAESAAAWRELLKLDGGGVDDWRQYAYELANDREAVDTSVSEEMEAAFTRLRTFDADDPLALFVLGHAAFNRGDKAAAKLFWSRLREILPADTPVSPTLDGLLEQVQ